MLSSGEEKAWDMLSKLDPPAVCRNTFARFDLSRGYYLIRSFCNDFCVIPAQKLMKSNSSEGETILKKYGYFFSHSCLWYLVHAKDLPLSGRLIKPSDIKGGGMFFRGSHVLPLDNLAKKYGDDKQAFLQRGKDLCAKVQHYGDASIQLLPLPRIPVTIILWGKDDEFPARADLLFDSTCELQLPLDIIWSIAMLSVLVMM
jgi:hypothetical protein